MAGQTGRMTYAEDDKIEVIRDPSELERRGIKPIPQPGERQDRQSPGHTEPL